MTTELKTISQQLGAAIALQQVAQVIRERGLSSFDICDAIDEAEERTEREIARRATCEGCNPSGGRKSCGCESSASKSGPSLNTSESANATC